MKKRCPTCEETKSIEEFVKDKSIKSGYGGYCKVCKRKKQSDWRKNHPGYDKKHNDIRKAGYSQEYHTKYQRERRKKDPLLKVMNSLRVRLSEIIKKKGLFKNKVMYLNTK